MLKMSAEARNASGKKKGGGFLRRAAGRSDQKRITEEDLLQKDNILPDDVLRLNRITESKYALRRNRINRLACLSHACC